MTTDTRTEAREATEKLHAKIAQVQTSDDFIAYLRLATKFHDYSPMNVLWMWAQWEARRADNPDLPPFSQPAAFSTWKELGRSVRKGEKALSVFAPIIITDKDDVDPDTGKGRRKCVGFKLKRRTFDIAQTEGDPLPEPPVTTLNTNEADPRLWDALVAHATSIGFKVEVDACDPGVGGYCSHDRKTIRVSNEAAGDQRIKTLIHELAHAHLHGEDFNYAANRPQAEVEAESVAYVVADLLGFNTDTYSVGYAAVWAARGDDAGAVLVRTIGNVVKTARKIEADVRSTMEALVPA